MPSYLGRLAEEDHRQATTQKKNSSFYNMGAVAFLGVSTLVTGALFTLKLRK